MSKIELSQLLRPGMTLDNELMTEGFYQLYNTRIVNVTPLYFCGLLAGSEFLTYAATKLYICYSIQIQNSTIHGETEGALSFYNDANAVFYNAKNQAAYWETVGAKDEFCINPVVIKNIYFSRLTAAIYDSVLFTGYRITIT